MKSKRLEKFLLLAEDGNVDSIVRTNSHDLESAWRRTSFLVALRVLQELEERGMSQADLARSLEVEPQYVCSLLSGSENFTLKTIAKLEKVLDIKIVDVVSALGR
jgi:ribosome-binding protein aMBF1 (putative translation factor)